MFPSTSVTRLRLYVSNQPRHLLPKLWMSFHTVTMNLVDGFFLLLRQMCPKAVSRIVPGQTGRLQLNIMWSWVAAYRFQNVVLSTKIVFHFGQDNFTLGSLRFAKGANAAICKVPSCPIVTPSKLMLKQLLQGSFFNYYYQN